MKTGGKMRWSKMLRAAKRSKKNPGAPRGVYRRSCLKQACPHKDVSGTLHIFLRHDHLRTGNADGV